jgi:hypothetical protein
MGLDILLSEMRRIYQRSVFNFAPQTLIPTPCIASIRTVLPSSLLMGEA